MNKYIALLITIVVVAEAADRVTVPVTIYYETLCSDSIEFFTKQFMPVWKKLNDQINVTLVPYGKSTPYNATAWMCHHGAVECSGNKIQSCLLEDVAPISQKLEIIDCLLKKSEATTPEEKYINNARSCITSTNQKLDSNRFIDCATSLDGNNALKKNQQLTEKLSPPLTSVPTIVFHNHYVAEESKIAEKNFLKALCKHFNENKPNECDSVNGALAKTASVITVLTTIVALYHI